MKKLIVLSLLFVAMTANSYAQRFALIDMEYILKNIPSYNQGMQQLEQASKTYQTEVETATKQAKDLYNQYQKQAKSLSETAKTQKENAIVAQEKKASELRKNYFGPEGELAKKREALLTPIQDKIYEAVKLISTAKNYSLVLDRASDSSVIFASPSIDISDDVLTRLGYSK